MRSWKFAIIWLFVIMFGGSFISAILEFITKWQWPDGFWRTMNGMYAGWLLYAENSPLRNWIFEKEVK